MSNEMWWGRSKWTWPTQLDTNWNSGWLEISDSISGPGKANAFALDQATYTVSLLGQYWLSPDRMDLCSEGGTHYSQPSVKLRGQLRGDTNRGLLFDKPDIQVDLELEQRAYFDGYLVDASSFGFPLTWRSDGWREKANQRNVETFGPSTEYDSWTYVDVDLEKHQNKTLNINVEAKLKIYLEGWAKLDPRNFAISIPQWELQEHCVS